MTDDEKEEKHIAYTHEQKGHRSTKQYKNGSCLTPHRFVYAEKDSCSYRWQAISKAKEAKTLDGKNIYNLHSEENMGLDDRSFRYISDAKGILKRGENTTIIIEKANIEVGKDGEKKVKDHVSLKNFTRGGAPYPNQVHHILCKASLYQGIDLIGDIHYETKRAIIEGLFAAKYNINYKDNTIILPCDKENALGTGLPIHPTNHPNYNKKIDEAVTELLRPYEDIANQMRKNKNHGLTDVEDIKKGLEDISNTMYQNLINLSHATRLENQGLKEEEKTAIKINDIPEETYDGIIKEGE